MSRFLKLENILHISTHFYNDLTGLNTERTHVKKIKASDAHYVNVLNIDTIVGSEHTTKDDDDQDVTVPATYLVFLYEGTAHDRGASGPRDRDAHILVAGTPEYWLAKIETAIASDAGLHHPQAEQDVPAHCLNDRGVWVAGEAYQLLDTVTHPDDASKTYLAVKASMTTSKAVLSNTGFWCEIVLAKL